MAQELQQAMSAFFISNMPKKKVNNWEEIVLNEADPERSTAKCKIIDDEICFKGIFVINRDNLDDRRYDNNIIIGSLPLDIRPDEIKTVPALVNIILDINDEIDDDFYKSVGLRISTDGNMMLEMGNDWEEKSDYPVSSVWVYVDGIKILKNTL
jgi:hypothetical protein